MGGTMGSILEREGGVAHSDAALLLHGMMCIAGADGSFSEAEMRMVEGYCSQLPELRGRDFDALMQTAQDIVERHPTVIDSLRELAELSSERLKTKLFVVAADLALATDRIDARESAMLSALQNVLAIEDELADKIVDVLSLKYA